MIPWTMNNERLHRPAPLFSAIASARPLRVVIDLECSDYDNGDVQQVNLLRGLLKHDAFETLQYNQLGAPPDAKRVAYLGGDAAEGWMEVHPVTQSGDMTHEIVWAHADGVTTAAISGDLARGEDLTSDLTYADDNPSDAARRRHDDSVAMAAASEAGCDVLVTNRPFLLQGACPMPGEVTACAPDEALAVVGLFLRSRGIYAAWATPEHGPTLTLDRGLYFWVGTRALLPEGWRWFTHCVYADGSGEPEGDLTLLAQSVFQRVGRALRLRDSLLRHMSGPQDNNVAEDALSDMDSILMVLMGAFDALARVAHRAAQIDGGEHMAGWQRRQWRTRLLETQPAFGALIGEGTRGADVLEVLRLLRNTVHGAALQPLGLGRGVGAREGTAVSLPSRDGESLVAVLQRRQWESHWGLVQFGGARFYVQPDRVIGHLLEEALPLINLLMGATPVEQFPRSRDGDEETALVRDEHNGPFAHNNQQSIRWQLGFD